MAIIVAADPGGIKPGTHSGTGYAVLDTEGMEILHMQIANHGPYTCVGVMQSLEKEFHADHMVCEDFVPRWGQPFKLDSVYLIGALQGHYNTDLKLVLPSQHTSKKSEKAFTPVPKLTKLMKDQGYKVGQGHSRMALSVAIYYATVKLKDKNAIDWKANRA